jgi:very-short-patch-repair endonuclease
MSIARSLRQRSTSAEKTVWRWLRNRTLGHLKSRRQHPIDGYVLDFYCAALKLCIEVDGGVHQRKVASDARRTDDLKRQGITVVRIGNDDVHDHPTRHLGLHRGQRGTTSSRTQRPDRNRRASVSLRGETRLTDAIGRRRPSPWPSPRSRGEGTGWHDSPPKPLRPLITGTCVLEPETAVSPLSPLAGRGPG